jgi:metal-responsive CopG/Arc/MetJ family transcriptional regulator
MKTIQIVLDARLLRAVDRAAKEAGMNRSAFFRHAAAEQLRRARIRALERRDRAGYERFPPDELPVWDKVTAWPED